MTVQPTSGEELRDALRDAASARRSIEIAGNRSKRLFGGAVDDTAHRITTKAMRRILRYEPKDLTISVEAGMPFAELQAELARNGQMIPLDGPYADQGTVGGVVASNTSGPRRRLFGTARDLVIGMRFATLDGRLADTGGMVVKNVAGLDVGKILIGSYGTLAAIASVNFKLIPKPVAERTFLFRYENVNAAAEAVGQVVRGQLMPAAIELINPLLAAQLNQRGYTLALAFGGNERLMARIEREMSAFDASRVVLSDEEDRRFWRALQAVTPRFLDKFGDGAVVRISTPLAQTVEALGMLDFAGVAHAGSGVVRGWFTRPEAATRYLSACLERGWDGVIEAAGTAVKPSLTLWPKPGGDFAMMKRVKDMFDPEGLLNRGRLFHRI